MKRLWSFVKDHPVEFLIGVAISVVLLGLLGLSGKVTDKLTDTGEKLIKRDGSSTNGEGAAA